MGLKHVLPFVALIALSPLEVRGQDRETTGARALAEFQRGDFARALSDFATGSEDDERFQLGEGAAHYRLKEFDKALESFGRAARFAKNDALRAEALYNSGNALVQLNRADEAVKAYEQALKLVPADREAEDNLQYAKKLLKEQQKQKQDQDQQQRSNEPKNDQDKQQDRQQSDQKQEPRQQNQDQQSSEKQDEQRNQDQQSHNQSSEQSKTDGQQDSKEQPQAEPEESRGKEHGQAEQQEEEPQSADENERLLNSVDESLEGLKEFRRQMGEERGRPITPEKDW